MAAINEVSIGVAAESTYGTPVTVTRWFEFLSGSDTLTKAPVVVESEGLRYGGKVKRASRSVVVAQEASGGFATELYSKGLGLLFENAMGSGASTSVSGSTYQQLFTLGAGSPAKILSIQKGVVDTTGTTRAQSYTSAVCKSFTVELENSGIAKASFDYDIQTMATNTAYASPSYATGGSLFTFAHAAIGIGGTVTVPTTTALASGQTAVTNINSFRIQVDNTVSTPRPYIGGSGLKRAPVLGERVITGSLGVEYSDNTLRDAILAQTDLALVLTFTSTETLTTGYAQFQICLPNVKFKGDMPKATGELPTFDVEFTAYDNEVAASPMYVAIRTADTAL